MISFKEWVERYESVDDHIGDLAKDISTDDRFPSKENNYRSIYVYLIGMNACKEALQAFNEAWRLYENEVRK